MVETSWVEAQLEGFPVRYVLSTSPERIASHLTAIQRVSIREPIVEVRFDSDLKICEYSLITL